MLNRILRKEQLHKNVFLIQVKAPHIAKERSAGQFVIVQVEHEYGERIPLTIADADPETESITLVFQAVGSTTRLLATLKEGDIIDNILGPLGHPTRIDHYGRVVCVGGGIGVAPLHPIAQALKAAGNDVSIIMGARSKELLILEDRMRKISQDVILCTDDGSAGRKALVTDPLREYCEKEPIDMVVAIGPPVMMKFCAETTRPFQVPTIVSLNSIMVDGTGMCGGCRVTVGGKTKFACVDGPEFDGHQVDFDNLLLRLKSFQPQEKKKHHCNLENIK